MTDCRVSGRVLTVARSGYFGLWLADTHLDLTAIRSGVRRRRFRQIEIFVFDLNNASRSLSRCSTKGWTLFRCQWSFGGISGGGTGRASVWACSNGRRRAPTGSCGSIMAAASCILSLRLVQDSFISWMGPVWHGSLPQLSRENDVPGLICGRLRLHRLDWMNPLSMHGK